MMFLFVAALLLAAPAMAETPAATLERAIASYGAGDFDDARAAFRTLADEGSAIGETMLGTMYARGEGVAADPATAAAYWLRAAQRGYPPAQLALAGALAGGRGVARDPGEAWLWASLAAEHGDAEIAAAGRRLAAAAEREIGAAERAGLRARLDAWRPWAVAVQ